MSKLTEYLKSHDLKVTKDKITFNKHTVTNPADKFLNKLGLKLEEARALNTPAEKRRDAYEKRADQHFHAYQAYTELGETEKAARERELWLAEREKIHQEFPDNQ